MWWQLHCIVRCKLYAVRWYDDDSDGWLQHPLTMARTTELRRVVNHGGRQ